VKDSIGVDDGAVLFCEGCRERSLFTGLRKQKRREGKKGGLWKGKSAGTRRKTPPSTNEPPALMQQKDKKDGRTSHRSEKGLEGIGGGRHGGKGPKPRG